MNKQQVIDLLMLLSALESWGLDRQKPMPDYLHMKLEACIAQLREMIGE